MSARVLLVDGTVAVGPAVPAALRRQGFLVSSCPAGRELARALDEVEPQIVIAEACAEPDIVQTVRRHSQASVLLVAERGTPPGKVRDADECLLRPFAMVDLIARVRTLSRRRNTVSGTQDVTVGDFHISLGGAVRHRGREVVLTRTERRLLALLASHQGSAIAKRDLLAAVWGSEAGDPNVVEVNVSTLRRKLERHGPRIVHTVRGLGYRLDDPVG